MTAPAGATVARVNPNDEQTARTTVKYGDLDLKTHEGADALYSRLSVAATRVCDDIMEPYVRLTRTYRECRDDALSSAVQEIDSPLVTQAYDRHTGKEPG